MSGQSPLLRIGITCAAIVLGSALVGSMLSTSQVSRLVEDENAGAAEDSSAHSGPEDDAAEGELAPSGDDDAEAAEEDWAEDETETASEGDELPEDQSAEQADEDQADEEEQLDEGADG